jgi:hypothetical protein
VTFPSPLDELPIHQTPLSMQFVGTSDRNFYDRWYFNAHDRTGDVFLVTGMGVYPNLGVVDAYAVVRRGDRQRVVRFSDALGDRRLSGGTECAVGPYRVEVVEPLQRIRLVCEGDEHGIGFDVTWDGSFPAVMEQPHIMRTGPRPILDASRFAQVGTWSGVLRVDGDEIAVDPERWVGTRDRSWGIRPVGGADPPGRYAAEQPLDGFWWLYVPMRFDDHAVIVIVQELPDGFRTLNDATRVWADGRHEQLGWPEVDIHYQPGTRHPLGATITLTERGGKPLTMEVDTLASIPLHVGCGYGGDSGWTHGEWRGRGWADGETYDMTDPEIVARTPFGVIDHVGRATCGGAEGWGLFEHGTMGRHDPSGFADWAAVAPSP